MLRVSYKNRIGHYTLTQKECDGESHQYRLHICHANCLCAIMYFYTDPEKGKMAQVHGFFTDPSHLKACIKQGFFEGADNFHFNADQLDADMWKFIKVIVAAGKKVTINPA